MQKSYRAPNPGDKRQWFLIDAKDRPLGRLAVVVANKLRAKDLPTYDPSVDAGAFVVVTNAALVRLTGKKESQKDYQRYSGYRDGLKHFTAAEMRAMMTRLKVFAAEADKGMLAAQKPVEIKL